MSVGSLAGNPAGSGTGRAAASSRPTARATLLFAAVAVLAAVLLWGLNTGSGSSRVARTAVARPPAGDALRSVPAGALGPVSAALGAGDGRYLVRNAAGGLSASNPAQQLHSLFTATGVSVSSSRARVRLDLHAVGYGSSLKPLSAVTPRASGNRVTYARRGVTEWYANGPAGVEQGFTVARPSASNSTGAPLTLSLGVSGALRPEVKQGGHTATLANSRGAILRYGGLNATDASGRRLHAWLAVRGSSLSINVAAAHARYPIRIDPFIESAQLTGSDGTEEDYAGYTAVVSGSTIAIGAPYRKVGGNAYQGLIYVFTRPPSGNWESATQTAELTASDAGPEEYLGYSLAMSGNTIAAADFHGTGRTYVFERPASGKWETGTESAVLGVSEPSRNGGIGYSVAVDGSTIVTGEPYYEAGETYRQGAAFVYSKPVSGKWESTTETALLTPSAGDGSEYFGDSVAVDGPTIVIGAPGHTAAQYHQGAAYVFSRPESGKWVSSTETALLSASGPDEEEELGYSVAVQGRTIVAGSRYRPAGAEYSGAVYVFEQPESTKWETGTETAQLSSSDATAEEELGWSVAIDGDTIVAGAPYHEVEGRPNQGVAYLYKRPLSGTWETATETQQLTGAEGQSQEYFGNSVSIAGATVAVGAPYRKIGSNTEQGQADVFSGPAPRASITGSSTFAAEAVGARSAPSTITLTNPGSAPLHVESVDLAGADAGQYSLGHDLCTGQEVAVEASCTVQLTFAPTALGAHNSAAIEFNDDAPTSPQSQALSGTGVATQTVVSTTPPPAPLPTCRSSRVESLHWLLPRKIRLSKVVISVNGHTYMRLPGSARSAKLSLVGYPKGRVIVRILGTSRSGARFAQTRIFAPCVLSGSNHAGLGDPYLRAVRGGARR